MTPDPLPLVLDATLRGTLLALLLLLAALMHRDLPRLAVARAGALLALGLCVQVVGSAPLMEWQAPLAWQAPFVAVSVANGVLFWLFVHALFDDDFAWRPWHAAAWGAVAALSGFNCLVAGSTHPAVEATRLVQRLVPLLFAALAALAAARHWRADLLESRRRLRAFILVTGVAYTAAMVVARLLSHGRLPGVLAMADALVLLLIVAGVAWRLLRAGTGELFAPVAAATGQAATVDVPAVSVAVDDPVQDQLAERLQRLMDEEHAYRSEDLSVARLADRLGAPEYRLRRVINQRLGHRNFNAYINGLRLQEARAALADPALRERPVLSIALDAGFQSIGPFNRAFKAATGLTPTEFRREKLAVS
jgi:AraC-like DNA-binding protein